VNNRYIGALVLAPFLLLLFLGGWFLKGAVLFLSFRGLYEYFYVVRKKGHKPLELLGYGFLAVYYLIVLFQANPLEHLGVLLALMVAISFIYMVFNDKTNITDVGITISGMVYTGVLFSFLILLGSKEYGRYYVPMVFVISWVCDTLAYYTGRLFGKHKLIERVSPKKTVEGAVGGLVGGIIGATVLGYFISNQSGASIIHFALMGLIGAFFGQIGDLAASSIKRYAGEKDYPKLIPGHGGVLDRFDSILFVALIVYIYTSYVL
jgi:phosphatidate cytidylyltransferase